MSQAKAILSVTDTAFNRIQEMLQNRGKPSLGIKIGLRTKGCSGLAYFLEFVDEANPLDEIVDLENMKIFIEPKAVMFLLGTEMDYKEEAMSAGFTFHNPNEKGRCGCGKSFHV